MLRTLGRLKSRKMGTAGGESYTGPLDLVPGAVVAYGVRALSAAMLGQNIFRLRRDSDNAELDFAADAVTGDAPAASIATWIGAGAGFVVTWYDQSGNDIHATQATANRQPLYVASATNSKPGFEFHGFSGAAVERLVTGNMGISGGFTAFAVSKINVPGALFGSNSDGDNQFYLRNATNSLDARAVPDGSSGVRCTGSSNIQATLGAYFIADPSMDATDQDIYVNNTNIPATDTAGAFAAYTAHPLVIGDMDLSEPEPFEGLHSELIIYDGYKANATRLPVRQNEATYYGVTLS